jgi:hypothetical protein
MPPIALTQKYEANGPRISLKRERVSYENVVAMVDALETEFAAEGAVFNLTTAKRSPAIEWVDWKGKKPCAVRMLCLDMFQYRCEPGPTWRKGWSTGMFRDHAAFKYAFGASGGTANPPLFTMDGCDGEKWDRPRIISNPVSEWTYTSVQRMFKALGPWLSVGDSQNDWGEVTTLLDGYKERRAASTNPHPDAAPATSTSTATPTASTSTAAPDDARPDPCPTCGCACSKRRKLTDGLVVVKTEK